MAIARCVQCWPPGSGRAYALAIEPIGYPDTALICGTAGCERPALLWLRASELIEYHGAACFRFPRAWRRCGSRICRRNRMGDADATSGGVTTHPKLANNRPRTTLAPMAACHSC